MALIVEVVDPRGGGVRARVRLDGAPLSIGRGYDNDVILEDAYVDARHARICVGEDGSVEIEDLGSINGLVVVDGGRVTRATALPGTQVRLGRTVLRFRDPSEPVPPALPDPARAGVIDRLLGSGRSRAVLCVGAVGLVAWYTWLGSYERDSSSNTIAMAVVFVLFAALWSGVWAVASRVVLNRFNFTAHLAVVALITIPALLLSTIDGWAAFVFPDNPATMPFSVVAWIGVFTASVALHLGLTSTMSRVRQWRTAAITIVTLALMVGLLAHLDSEQFTDIPEFSGVVKPFSERLLPTMDVASFSDVIAGLKEEADELARD